MKKQQTLVVIDGKSVLYRAYYAMGDLTTPDGRPTGATYGFARMGLDILKRFSPDYVAVAWDKSGTNIRYRQKLYEEYKANRKPMPDELRQQIDDVRRLSSSFGWPLLEVDDYEADDIMGTLALQAGRQNINTILVTSDLDVLQLINSNTQVCVLKKGLSQTVLYDEEKFRQDYGMSPSQFVDYKSLRGDPSDNIPGVKGVGEKTALELIHTYGDLEAVYNSIDQIGGAVASKLQRDEQMAFLSRDLIKLSLEAPVTFDALAAKTSESRPNDIAALFSELNFTRLKSQLPSSMQPPKELNLFDGPDLTSRVGLEPAEETAPTANTPKKALVVVHGEDYYVSPNPSCYYRLNSSQLTGIKEIVGHNTKSILKLSTKAHVDMDVMVAAFLLNPLRRDLTLQSLASDELGVNIETDESVDVGKIVAATWSLYRHFKSEIQNLPRLGEVASKIEWPLLPVLARMESVGIGLDVEYLHKIRDDFASKIKDLKVKIYEQAGEEFNINSPQQLRAVLFEKLELPTQGIKKTKTGYSTSASELDKLQGQHEIVDLIGQYRELTKLQSTYVEALPKLTGSDGRLHTTFTQTVTQTGRLSSINPNVQNIPVRTDEGRLIRRAFKANEGNVLIQADYSQIELRIAAALSRDEKMLRAFEDEADIHTQTAAELHNVTAADVTKAQRYSAKAINFGVLYGMSPHGLSLATGMSHDESKAFIERYFSIRAQLKEYLEELKQQAKTNGFVETWYGRRRPMPDIHSSNFAVRSAAERAAMNMPIQGTAADIMKLAMIELDAKLDSDCKQVLQVHDSVLVECPEGKASSIKIMLREVMEGICPRPEVNLRVDITTGANWGDIE